MSPGTLTGGFVSGELDSYHPPQWRGPTDKGDTVTSTRVTHGGPSVKVWVPWVTNRALFQLSHATRVGSGVDITLSFALIKVHLFADAGNL